MKSEEMTIKNLLELYYEKLGSHYPENEIRNFLYILYDHYLKWPKTLLHQDPERRVPTGEAALLIRALKRLQKHEPVQYITGTAFFRGMEFHVCPGVLIPRPETEQLADLVVKKLNRVNSAEMIILDIGTGSGCIAVAMKKEFPGARVIACDISETALAVAADNAKHNKADIRFIHSDILVKEQWPDLPAAGVIISNPPYVTESGKKAMKKNVLEYEPGQALFVPDEDPLKFYHAITGFAKKNLVNPGILCLEINEETGDAVRELLTGKGFVNVSLSRDLNGKDRFVLAELKG
jgi:release factor glutamine methyltransferase